MPEAQAEAGIGREDCLEAGPLSVAPWVLLRVELCPLPNLNVKVLTLVPKNVALFGERVFTEVIKLK